MHANVFCINHKTLKRMLIIGILILIFVSSTSAFAHGEVHERILIVSEEIANSPNDPMLYVKRANMYLEDGDYDETILDIYKAIEIGGDNYAPVKMVTAHMYFKLGMNEIALKHIDHFLILEEDHVLGLLTKAKILVEMKQNEQAAEYFQQAIEKTTTHLPENFMDLVNVLVESGQLELALQYCELAQFKFGKLLVFDLKIIEIANQKEDYEMVLKILDQIIETQERKEKWYFQKAEICQLMKDFVQAEYYLNLAEQSIKELPERIQLTPAMKQLAKLIQELKEQEPTTNAKQYETNLVTH
jgi:tetratricopeptide (TPR) repeat protein